MCTELNTEAELQRLDQMVETLLGLYGQLRQENSALREDNRRLEAERAKLMEKAAIARNRVEAMISRLHSLGQESL